MSSLERKTASRANGARSKGPITSAGKSRSSKNATRHGLMAKCVVLDCESREDFDFMQSEFVARFRPADGVELGLVEEMLSALCSSTIPCYTAPSGWSTTCGGTPFSATISRTFCSTRRRRC
jgi:hypothetical protein